LFVNIIMNKTNTYCFKLTNSITVVNLPIPIENAEKIKIKQIRFNTGVNYATYETLLIKIQSFNSNIYFDGNKKEHYTKMLLLPNVANVPVIYENTLTDDDANTEKAGHSGLSDLHIELLINNQYTTDINISNPLFLELTIS